MVVKNTFSYQSRHIDITPPSNATETQLEVCRLMPPWHIGTGHSARHINQTPEANAALPLWQDGDTDNIVEKKTEGGSERREFRVAPPAMLNDYQRSLVG
jgi:hypothetical protein